MSATLDRPATGPGPVLPAADPARKRGILGSDARVLAVLALALAVITTLTWRKWGSPEIDPGAELTTADLVAHGSVPYLDVRYFYGPAGLYALALTFKVFGASYGAAFAFGFVQTIAILGTFYALARRWLTPAAAGFATAIMIAIAFSGTTFDFVLPHTNSATFGILFVLASLLALSHDRFVLAGVAAGVVGLTRPEFAAIELGVLAAFLVGAWRDRGLRAAWSAAWRIALPGAVIAGGVLGALAAAVGTSNLFTENLWPVEFMRQAGFESQGYWMPFDFASAVGLLARGGIYVALVGGLLGAAVVWSRTAGLGRVRVALPLVGALVVVGVLDGVARAAGVAGEVETELKHLLIGMSALPAIAFAVAAWTLVRFVRGRRSPLEGDWATDLALVAAAAAFGLRAYNAFTAEGSYAPYYAAPLVLVLAIMHARAGRQWPAARPAALVALGLVAVGLSAYAVKGIYGDETAVVKTARGTFVTQADAAPALQKTLAAIDRGSAPGSAILAAPSEGGLYFMSDRRPALHELMLLPGLLATAADERSAVARLERQRVGLAVIAARDYRVYGRARFGVDFDPILGSWLDGATRTRTVIGTLSDPAGGTYPSRGFTVLNLQP